MPTTKSRMTTHARDECTELCLPTWKQNISESERWMSLGGGVAMTATGLMQGGWRGMLMSGIGASLILRGMTGHCFTYEALGIDTAG